MGKNIFNTYSYSYINDNPDLTFGGYDSDGNPYWMDDSGKVYYQDNSMGQSSSGDGNQQGDNGNNQGNNNDPHNTGWNPANYGPPINPYGPVITPPVLSSWPGSPIVFPSSNSMPGVYDIPQTGGPDKYTQESLQNWALQTAQAQQARNNGQPVVLVRNNNVGGIPVQKTVLLSPGIPGQPTYTINVDGPINPDGTLLNNQALTLTLPQVPGSSTGQQTMTSNGPSGSGPSGGGSGGPSGGSPSGGTNASTNNDCDCEGTIGSSGAPDTAIDNGTSSNGKTLPASVANIENATKILSGTLKKNITNVTQNTKVNRNPYQLNEPFIPIERTDIDKVYHAPIIPYDLSKMTPERIKDIFQSIGFWSWGEGGGDIDWPKIAPHGKLFGGVVDLKTLSEMFDVVMLATEKPEFNPERWSRLKIANKSVGVLNSAINYFKFMKEQMEKNGRKKEANELDKQIKIAEKELAKLDKIKKEEERKQLESKIKKPKTPYEIDQNGAGYYIWNYYDPQYDSTNVVKEVEDSIRRLKHSLKHRKYN